MQHGENAFFGLPQAELLQHLGIDKSTFHRWRKGKSQPPQSAVLVARILINGELVQGGRDWKGWHINRARALVGPNGQGYTPAEIAAIPYWIRCARFRHQADQEPEQLILRF